MKILILSVLCYGLASLAAPDLGAAQVDDCRRCTARSAEVGALIETSDRLYAQFKPQEAAEQLQKALQLDPGNHEALAKLSRAHIDIGDQIPEAQTGWRESKIREYHKAENFARRAINADPRSTWGYFYLAASLGTTAGFSSVDKQIEMAKEIRVAVEKAIELDPANGFAYHVYGVWHRRMAEIGSMSRVFVSVLYGGSLPKGSLEKSIQYLEKAVSLNPKVIISRLELARSHAAAREWAAARTQLRSIADLPVQFSDDAKHKRTAAELLEEIKDR